MTPQKNKQTNKQTKNNNNNNNNKQTNKNTLTLWKWPSRKSYKIIVTTFSSTPPWLSYSMCRISYLFKNTKISRPKGANSKSTTIVFFFSTYALIISFPFGCFTTAQYPEEKSVQLLINDYDLLQGQNNDSWYYSKPSLLWSILTRGTFWIHFEQNLSNFLHP